MAAFYKVLKADPLGEAYTPSKPGAKPIQSYWCQVEGQELAVMVGKQVRDDGQPALTAGQNIYGDLMVAKSQKGTSYWKFKSAMVPEGVQRPSETGLTQPVSQPTQPTRQVDMSATMPDWFRPIANQLSYIEKKLRELTDDEPGVTPIADVPTTGAKDPEPPMQVTGAPLDDETSQMLDDIFGPQEGK